MISRINGRLLSVNEKSEKVLEQYDIAIKRIVRGRGGIIAATDKGYKLFIQCEKADKYYERENRITSLLTDAGYCCTDTYVRNREGGLISEDEDGRKYIMKNWYDARESNVREESDMCRAIAEMANMHLALRKVALEQVETELIACQNNRQDETELRKMYTRHTRELKKAHNYLKQRKRRQDFEQIAFNNIESFYDEACIACERLASEEFSGRLIKAAQDMEISHGSYTYHNVLVNGKNTYVVNFDKYKNECQISDLYQFVRKVMEKYNWDGRMFYRLVDEYDRICPLSDEEMNLLLVLLSYPEKFWKIINQYINSNKSWIPEKNVEKIRKVIEQNGRKRELIDKICCVW